MVMKSKKIWELEDYKGEFPSEEDILPVIDVNGDADQTSDWDGKFDKAVTRQLSVGKVKTQMMQMAAKWITELGRTTAESLTGWDSATQSPKEQGEIPDLAVIIKSIYGWINNNAVDIDGLLTLMEERIRGTRGDGGNNAQILINTYAKSDFLINLMKTLSGTLRSINSPIRDYIPNIPTLRHYFEESYGYTLNQGVDGTWYVSAGTYPMYVKRDETGKIIKTLNVESKPCLTYSRGVWSELDLTQDTPQHITEVRIKGWADLGAYSNWDYSGEQWAFGRYMDTLLGTIVVPKDRNPRNLTIKEGDLTGFTVSIPKGESEARHIQDLEFVQEELGVEDSIKGKYKGWITTITDEGPVAEYKGLTWVNGDFDNAFTDGIPYPNFQELNVYAGGMDEVLFVDPDYKSYTPPEGFVFVDTAIFTRARKRDGQWNWFGYYSPKYDTEFTSEDFPNTNVITAEGDVPLAFATEPVVSDAWKPYHVDFLGDPYPISLSALLGHNNIIKCNWTRDLEGAWILESTEGRMFNSLLFADDAETIAESISYNYYDAGGMTNGGNEPNYELTVYEYLDAAVPNKTRDGGELMNEAPAEEERETVVFDTDFIADCLDGMDVTAAAQIVIGVITSLISGHGGGGETPEASDISYENNNSWLRATNVQGAIDELDERTHSGESTASAQPTHVIYIDTTLSEDIPGKAYTTFAAAKNFMEDNVSNFYLVELPAGAYYEAITCKGNRWTIHGNQTRLLGGISIAPSYISTHTEPDLLDCSINCDIQMLRDSNQFRLTNCEIGNCSVAPEPGYSYTFFLSIILNQCNVTGSLSATGDIGINIWAYASIIEQLSCQTANLFYCDCKSVTTAYGAELYYCIVGNVTNPTILDHCTFDQTAEHAIRYTHDPGSDTRIISCNSNGTHSLFIGVSDDISATPHFIKCHISNINVSDTGNYYTTLNMNFTGGKCSIEKPGRANAISLRDNATVAIVDSYDQINYVGNVYLFTGSTLYLAGSTMSSTYPRVNSVYGDCTGTILKIRDVWVDSAHLFGSKELVGGTQVPYDYRPRRYKYSHDTGNVVTSMDNDPTDATYIGILKTKDCPAQGYTPTVNDYIWMPYVPTLV